MLCRLLCRNVNIAIQRETYMVYRVESLQERQIRLSLCRTPYDEFQLGFISTIQNHLSCFHFFFEAKLLFNSNCLMCPSVCLLKKVKKKLFFLAALKV